MIDDADFKLLLHNCRGYKVFAKGESIGPGYKPDYVLSKGNDFIILESERSSSRKTFIGGMIKAAHFLQGERTGTLVYIMTPKGNTKAVSIVNQLNTYLSWIADKTNLRDVYVIEHGHYCQKGELLTLLSKAFKAIALKV